MLSKIKPASNYASTFQVEWLGFCQQLTIFHSYLGLLALLNRVQCVVGCWKKNRKPEKKVAAHISIYWNYFQTILGIVSWASIPFGKRKKTFITKRERSVEMFELTLSKCAPPLLWNNVHAFAPTDFVCSEQKKKKCAVSVVLKLYWIFYWFEIRIRFKEKWVIHYICTC